MAVQLCQLNRRPIAARPRAAESMKIRGVTAAHLAQVSATSSSAQPITPRILMLPRYTYPQCAVTTKKLLKNWWHAGAACSECHR